MRMFRRGVSGLAGAAMVMTCVIGARTNASASGHQKRVLVLNSTRHDEQFSVVSEREVPKLLAEGLGEEVDYYTKYFDALRFPQPEFDSAHFDFLRLKYDGRPFDLLIVMGDIAINFMTAHRDVDQVDWRQLRRWDISEARMPAGAGLLFKEPSAWDRYKRYIVGAIALMAAQSVLIAGLLLERSRRRSAERELRGSEAKLRVSYERIRHLGRRLLGEQEAERARVARGLHDDISQQLVVGLVAALDSLQRGFSRPHLSLTFSHRDVPSGIDHDIALCVYRVAQEALQNVIKHSAASRASLQLTGGASNVMLTITDDGKGFDVEHTAGDGLGLISMRERVESVGGILQIQSTRGQGTRLSISVPIHVTAALPSIGATRSA